MVNTTHNIEMKLIADSGSTKTDWILIDGSNNIVTTFSTKGLNPNIVSDEQIVFELNNEIQLKEYSGSPLKLFFMERDVQVLIICTECKKRFNPFL